MDVKRRDGLERLAFYAYGEGHCHINIIERMPRWYQAIAWLDGRPLSRLADGDGPDEDAAFTDLETKMYAALAKRLPELEKHVFEARSLLAKRA